MSPTSEQRSLAYDQASTLQRHLYSSADSGEQLYNIAERYGLNSPDTYRIFAITVGDVILGFYSIEDLPNLLRQELSATYPESLFAELRTFLQPLLLDEKTNIPSDIAEMEQALNISPQIRTLASDSVLLEENEPTYTSTQAAILNEGQRTPTPPGDANR